MHWVVALLEHESFHTFATGFYDYGGGAPWCMRIHTYLHAKSSWQNKIYLWIEWSWFGDVLHLECMIYVGYCKLWDFMWSKCGIVFNNVRSHNICKTRFICDESDLALMRRFQLGWDFETSWQERPAGSLIKRPQIQNNTNIKHTYKMLQIQHTKSNTIHICNTNRKVK